MYLNYNLYCQSNACLLLEKRKKTTTSAVLLFWLHILACILCLSALINIHDAHVYKNLKLCHKFMFRQILSSNSPSNLKAPCGRKRTKGLPTVSPCMPSNSKAPTSVVSQCSVRVVTYFILMSSSHVQKHINVSPIGVLNSPQHRACALSPFSRRRGRNPQSDFRLRAFLVPEGSLLFRPGY